MCRSESNSDGHFGFRPDGPGDGLDLEDVVLVEEEVVLDGLADDPVLAGQEQLSFLLALEDLQLFGFFVLIRVLLLVHINIHIIFRLLDNRLLEQHPLLRLLLVELQLELILLLLLFVVGPERSPLEVDLDCGVVVDGDLGLNGEPDVRLIHLQVLLA